MWLYLREMSAAARPWPPIRGWAAHWCRRAGLRPLRPQGLAESLAGRASAARVPGLGDCRPLGAAGAISLSTATLSFAQ